MPLLDDLAAYLVTQGIGTVDVDIYAGKLPDQPDACIALQARGGLAPDIITTIEQPGVRMLVRDVDTPAGMAAANARAYALKLLLHRSVGLVLNGILYHRIDAIGNPQFIGQDQRGRPKYEISFIVTKEDG